MGKQKKVSVTEIRIGWICPHCDGRMWVGSFNEKKSGTQKCVYCKKEIVWSVVIEENK